MKTIIVILLLTFSLNIFCQKEYNEEKYGQTWTKIIQCDNKLQAKYIIFRYGLANIGQEINKNENGYYIELTYYDDDNEKFWNKFYCIPKRFKKNIQIIEFILIDKNNPLDMGNGNYLTW